MCVWVWVWVCVGVCVWSGRAESYVDVYASGEKRLDSWLWSFSCSSAYSIRWWSGLASNMNLHALVQSYLS